jgi:hypothetical protein
MFDLNACEEMEIKTIARVQKRALAIGFIRVM